MSPEPVNWPRDSICMRPASLDAASFAAEVYRRTCRVGFDAPGFCVLNLGRRNEPDAFRQTMIDLKHELAAIHESTTGKTLAYVSAGRFDQQETTRPHLDGGPDECLLVLGYEPSTIGSAIDIFDYTKCAFDLGLAPGEFMARHNPMFKSGGEILAPYAMRIPCFSKRDYRIVCVNNSCAPFSAAQPAWQGVLHSATIFTPDASQRRMVNSTMIASAPAGTPDEIATW